MCLLNVTKVTAVYTDFNYFIPSLWDVGRLVTLLISVISESETPFIGLEMKKLNHDCM